PRTPARGAGGALPLRPQPQPLPRRPPRGIEDFRLVQGRLRAAAGLFRALRQAARHSGRRGAAYLSRLRLVAERLSIVVPALNEAAGIRAALEALAPLRARGHEVIVVDGGSDDGTAGLAAGLCDRVMVAPRGRAAQMNAGAREARGDILLFLHADTRLPGNFVLENHVWGRFDVRIEGRHWLLPVVAWSMNLRSRLTGIATGDQAIFVRRDAFPGFP